SAENCYADVPGNLSSDVVTNGKGVGMTGIVAKLTVFCMSVLATAWSLQAQEALNLFDSALAQVGMTADEVRFDYDELATWGGDRFRLNYFTLFHKNPFKLPRHGELILNSFADNVTNPTALVARGSRMIGYPIFRGLIGDQLSAYMEYPDSVSVPSITRSKNILVGSKYNALKDRIDLIYRLAEDDDFLFRKGLSKIDKDKYRRRLFDYFINDNNEYHDVVYELLDKVDFNRMYAGAQDFAEAVKRAADSVDQLVFPDHVVEFRTRKGSVVIGTPGDDTYAFLNPPLLIFDGGGNDSYRISGYPNGSPFTAVIDIGGDDIYISADSTSPGLGGAVIGMSVVIDVDGHDRYETVNLSQGAGLFGVGVLMDHRGDDTHICRSLSQGAGVFGIGILADSAGNDSLFCLSTSQGYGYTKGIGILVNGEGNDRYIADDVNIVNPSPQTAEHNSSLAQGVGFGKRADYIDGHSWAGGVGILCDASGDDIYSAGLFAQGCAYWFALGVLLDGDGKDAYNGVWYVQGSGAHFAVGYLDDFSGDDTYTATHNMAVGAGHDFTVGYFNERAGSDTYSVPNLSLGGGNANGIGIFHDYIGDDIYTTKGGTTLGRANASNRGPRQYLGVFGVFVDGGGVDSYLETYAENGTRWISPKSSSDDPNPYEIGVGIDW
ncbi:MAG: hypothetical protein JSU65_00545, partial [Candidatus Zixiibacteriota bacterium]